MILLGMAAVPLLGLSVLFGTPAALALYMVGRMGAAGASTICYVAAAEQFPTTCRSLAVGFGASCGRLGSIGSPLVWMLPGAHLILASISLCATACVVGLSETAGKSIPDNIDDMRDSADYQDRHRGAQQPNESL